GRGVDNYTASKSEWVFMANAYVDLSTWYCITPYIGAGFGGTYNRISSFRDDGVIFIGGNLAISDVFAEDSSRLDFAWSLQAGLPYKVTPAMSIDLGYRYISLGKAETGPFRAFDGSFTNGGPFIFNDIFSHDFKLGVRWMLEAPFAPPLMRRG